jgi:hypothetical protein
MNEGWDEKLEEGARCKSWLGVSAIRACFWKFLQRTPRSSAASQPRSKEQVFKPERQYKTLRNATI